MEEQVKEDSALQRLPNGLFAKGNSIGKGVHRSPGVIAELRKAMTETVTPDVMRRLTQRLIDLAETADPKISILAIELLYNRILGKPKETVELDVNQQVTGGTALLDSDDLAALDRMRRKLTTDAIIDVEPAEQQPPPSPV
jgi:hypothetical protein